MVYERRAKKKTWPRFCNVTRNDGDVYSGKLFKLEKLYLIQNCCNFCKHSISFISLLRLACKQHSQPRSSWVGKLCVNGKERCHIDLRKCRHENIRFHSRY